MPDFGLSWLEWVNVFFCMLGALATYGAINRMNDPHAPPGERRTPVTIQIGFATVMAAFMFKGFAYFSSVDWQMSSDTLLLGGVLSVVLGSRRRTLCIDPRHMPKMSAGVSLATWVLFLGVLA